MRQEEQYNTKRIEGETIFYLQLAGVSWERSIILQQKSFLTYWDIECLNKYLQKSTI